MNLGIVTSYIIGGLLLLAIITMNMSVSNSSIELTLTQTTREKASSVSEVISHDIQKIGYNRNNKTDPILVSADSNKIQFRSNIDNSYDNSVELITWEFTNTGVASTQNPNDYVLMRTVKDLSTGSEEQTPIRLGVTNFNIKYYDTHGKELSNNMTPPLSSSELESVKQLYIELELQSAEQIYQNSNNGRYIRSVWEKRFSPPNLEN